MLRKAARGDLLASHPELRGRMVARALCRCQAHMQPVGRQRHDMGAARALPATFWVFDQFPSSVPRSR